MTGLPAKKFKLQKRGRIEKQYFADIAIINLDKITDRATYQAPHQYSEGISHLLVNVSRLLRTKKHPITEAEEH